jgi:protein MAK11
MRLYAGCYERFLFGFKVQAEDDGITVSQEFSQPAHRHAVKCVASRGDFVITGGADDQIHLFNVVTDKDLGFLVNPVEGPVPCIAFVSPDESPQPSHLLSGVLQYAEANRINLFSYLQTNFLCLEDIRPMA